MNSVMLNFQKLKGYSVKEHLPTYLKLALFWCPAFSFIFLFLFSQWKNPLASFMTSYLISLSCATFCYFGSYLMNALIDFVLSRFNRGPFEASTVGGVALSYPFLPFGLYFGFAAANAFRASIGATTFDPGFSDYKAGLIYGVIISGVFLLFEVIQQVKDSEKKVQWTEQQLENEKLKAQISALTAQMNPHLLFNSLNTIASTISEKPEMAEEMTVQLSQLYRGILAATKGELHSLAKEIEICESYLQIENMRFGERVTYEVNVDKAVMPESIEVPILILQPIVENAIKHGLSPKKEGGHVKVDIAVKNDQLHMSVVDNGMGVHAPKSNGTGTGLKNSESRIQLRYGDKGHFLFDSSDRGTRVEMAIPVEQSDA